MRLTPLLRNVLLATGSVALLAGTGLRILRPAGAAIDETRFLPEIAPSVSFGPKKGSPPHYVSDTGVAAFNSFDVTPTIRGYNGPIKVLLSIDSGGTILGIRILEHVETKNFVHRLDTPEFLGQFVGKNVADPFEIDRDIDGISRATVTVEALNRTVRESSRRVARDVFGLSVGAGGTTGESRAGAFGYGMLLAFALGAYGATRRSPRLLRLRDLSLAGGILVVGVWLSNPLSVLHILNLSLLRFSSRLLWLVGVPGILLTLVLFGRVYCGWLCPFGALAELLGRIPARKWRPPTAADHQWRNMKYAVLWAVVVIVSVTARPDFAAFETYVTLFSAHGTAPAWVLMAVMLAANLRVPRFWCRYLCPVGALGGLLSRTVPGYPSIPSCPMGNSPAPPGSECIRCNRCRRPARETGQGHD